MSLVRRFIHKHCILVLIISFAGLTDMSKNVISKPAFFGAAIKDYVCLAILGKKIMEPLCPHLKVVDFDTDHWIPFAAPDKLNTELQAWIDDVVKA